jgi:hypothetical protein
MTSRLIDAYARPFAVTQTHVVLVDADPAAVADGLQRLPLSNPATAACEALGIMDRLAAGPSQLAARGTYERVYGLIWRLPPGRPVRLEPHDIGGFAAPGHVKVFWDVDVSAGALDGAVLASTMRFVATDEAARTSLLAAWALVGGVSTALCKRALATLRRYAEEHDEPASGAPTATDLRLVA